MEIKCQLDATEVFIADLIACSTCFGHHYAHHQELKNIIQCLLPVVFRAVVFKLLVWCWAEGYVSGLQDVALLKNVVYVVQCSKESLQKFEIFWHLDASRITNFTTWRRLIWLKFTTSLYGLYGAKFRKKKV